MKKTTEKHLAAFEKEARFWIEKLGLLDWEVAFKREKLDGNRAEIGFKYIDRVATLFLTSEWTNTITPLTMAAVRQVAKHEVLELLIADVRATGRDRFSSMDELDYACHSLIRRLEKAL